MKIKKTITRMMGHMGLISLIGLLASCKGEMTLQPEVPVPNDLVAISFIGQELEEQTVTKAALSESATSFTVWGYKNMSYSAGEYGGLQTVFPGYNVNWSSGSAATTTSNSNGWEYVGQEIGGAPEQTIKFWDWGAVAYRFFGVTTPNEADKPRMEYLTTPNNAYEITMTANAENMAMTPYYSRLWFSTGNAEVYPTRLFGRPVQLEFLKPFARVRFLYKFANPSGELPEPILEDAQFKPMSGAISLKGTFTVNYPLDGEGLSETWETSNITRTMLAFTVAYTEDNKMWYTVLPAKGQGAYILTLRVNGEEHSCTVPAAYMNWLPNYQYTYVFKVSEEGGVELDSYNAAYTDWKEGSEGEQAFYNW